MRLGRLWEFTKKSEINPDELLVETQQDINKTGERLKNYFIAKAEVTSHNTAHTSVGYIRGLYTHNNIVLPRSFKLPKKHESQIVQTDDRVAFYDYDEKTKEMVFKSDKLRYWIQNLPFRDQVVALALISTGADTADLLSLNVGFARDSEGNVCDKERLFWRGRRKKTNQPFRTFFSKEATTYLKRYIGQERSQAKDDEPLFVGRSRKYIISKGEHKGKEVTVDERLKVHAVATSFRNASQTIGETTTGEANPMRPKRFRRIFRSACSLVDVDIGFIKCLMGHSMDVNSSYLERDAPF